MTNSTQANRNDALMRRTQEDREMKKSEPSLGDILDDAVAEVQRWPDWMKADILPEPKPACHCGGAAKIAELRKALADASEALHSEFCGTVGHHRICAEAHAALAIEPPAPSPPSALPCETDELFGYGDPWKCKHCHVITRGLPHPMNTVCRVRNAAPSPDHISQPGNLMSSPSSSHESHAPASRPVSGKWMVGNQDPHNLYDGDRFAVKCHNVEDAAWIARIINDRPSPDLLSAADALADASREALDVLLSLCKLFVNEPHQITTLKSRIATYRTARGTKEKP